MRPPRMHLYLGGWSRDLSFFEVIVLLKDVFENVFKSIAYLFLNFWSSLDRCRVLEVMVSKLANVSSQDLGSAERNASIASPESSLY